MQQMLPKPWRVATLHFIIGGSRRSLVILRAQEERQNKHMARTSPAFRAETPVAGAELAKPFERRRAILELPAKAEKLVSRSGALC